MPNVTANPQARQIINQLEPLEIVDFKHEPAHTPAPKLITIADPIKSAKKGFIILILRIIL